MGRSRSRSREKGEYYAESEPRSSSRSRRSGHKSRDKSRSRSRERGEYEETKEERRARRARERAEKRRDSPPKATYDESYASRGYEDQSSARYGGAAPAAPYPESPQDSRAGYGGAEYQQTSYPADSYAQSGYTSGTYPSHTSTADYGSSQTTTTVDYTSSQPGYTSPQAGYTSPQPGYYGPTVPPVETQPYGAPQHEPSAYYHQSPPPTQYGEPTYSTAPQPPYPTTQYPEDTTTVSPAPYAPPIAVAPYPHEGNQYPPPPPLPSDVPSYGYGQPQPGYQDPKYGAYSGPPQPSSYGETPRNPSHHNYNPRPEPSGAPPEADVEFQIGAPGQWGGQYGQQPTSPSGEQWRPTAQQEKKSSFLSSFASSLHVAIHDVARDFTTNSSIKAHHDAHEGGTCRDPNHFQSDNRFSSFAPVQSGNKIKWFVDGKDYCWAVAEAISRAQQSIWILDWWLSPEIHLRRPAAKYQEYRLDRMLVAAAQRGVKINIIVYKEVTQALTLGSAHTKHFLEEAHPNIAVVRHPDHNADQQVVASKLAAGQFGEALSSLTGVGSRMVLYWAHHEKLCLIDGTVPGGGIAFMGGLDLCWGRWDLSHHPIADVHPTDIKETIFLGQDYNNARVMDFHTVDQWTQNKLKRTESSRMGWSDIALCLTGPSVEDLKVHFTERWNFIWKEKYSFKSSRYQELRVEIHSGEHGRLGGAASKLKSGMKGIIGRNRGPEEDSRRRYEEYDDPLAFGDSDDEKDRRRRKRDKKQGRRPQYEEPEPQYGGEQAQYVGHHPEIPQQLHHGQNAPHGTHCQIVRSASDWSHGTKTEHSVQNAYIQIINNAQHFIYIENQFFITATGGEGGWPVKNRIGEALVNRIIRAHEAREKFRVIVIMPSVPAFAGALADDGSLGTRAIMEFQYDSISRGGKGRSIYERLNAKGINPLDYIRFFNLRNYDRLNISRELEDAERRAGFEYEVAQQALEDKHGAGWTTAETHGGELDQWSKNQGGVSRSVWDSVTQCSMLGGGDIRDVPWAGDPDKEIDAFVTEELYVHSKVLIADDKIVICGSANLNDRSQLGDHDSEIAIIVEDHTPLYSLMNGQQYIASNFAATLRRYLFRKHLGLIPAQSPDLLDPNMLPVPEPNVYDFDSEEDKIVMDPLSDNFWNRWNSTAKTNTDAFATVFHAVPYDGILNWNQYKEYFGKYYEPLGTKENPLPPKYPWGHVFKEAFPPGAEGAHAVKEVLARVRGSLVEMPLKFLQDIDLAIEGLSYNAATDELYT